MSTVIKLGSARTARIVAPYAPPPAAPVADVVRHDPPKPDPRKAELDRLHALLAEHTAALKEAKAEVAKARTEGEAAGRAAAEMAVEDSREQALELLRGGIERALGTLADGREQMEVLALLVARTALEKLFGDDRGRKEAVGALVMRQLQSVERQTLLRIEVSRQDFPDTRELAAFATEIGADEKLVSANAEFPAGACRMQLRVGTLDVGVDQQWRAVRDVLDELAAAAEVQP